MTTPDLDRARRLALWRDLCVWLEQQSYNAAYPLSIPGKYHSLLSEDRQMVKERNELALIFWSTGDGWRLRKDYRAKLAKLGLETPEPPAPPKRERKRQPTLAEVRRIYAIYESQVAERGRLPDTQDPTEQRLIARGWLELKDGGVLVTKAGRAAVKAIWPELLEDVSRARWAWLKMDRFQALARELHGIVRHAGLDPYHARWDAQMRETDPTFLTLSDDEIREVCRRYDMAVTGRDPEQKEVRDA